MNDDKTFVGRFYGWMIGKRSVEGREARVQVQADRQLGQPRVVVHMQRPAPTKLRDERAELHLLPQDALDLALRIGGAVLRELVSPSCFVEEKDLAESERIEVALVAGYALAVVARDGGRSRETARAGIERVLLGWLWNGEHPGMIAAWAVALAWDGTSSVPHR